MNSRSNWQRLHDIGEKRRQQLGLRQADLEGVSPQWVRGLPGREGAPSAKMRAHLDAYDVALGWPAGTSWRLVRDPFDDGSPAAVDQEDRLVYGDETTKVPVTSVLSEDREQSIRDFGTIVMGSLRNMDDASAERTMRDIIRLLGL